jgi:hypothetical protein
VKKYLVGNCWSTLWSTSFNGGSIARSRVYSIVLQHGYELSFSKPFVAHYGMVKQTDRGSLMSTNGDCCQASLRRVASQSRYPPTSFLPSTLVGTEDETSDTARSVGEDPLQVGLALDTSLASKMKVSNVASLRGKSPSRNPLLVG